MSDWVPILIGAAFAGVILAAALLVAYKVIAEKRRLVKLRATVEPLGGWIYPAAEWKRVAGVYELSSHPDGAAKLRITPLDIWIDDDKNSVRLELDSNAKCVTDCRLTNNTLKFRVRWWETYGKGGKYYYFKDFLLPVPSDKEKEAALVVDYFKDHIAAHPDEVMNVTPKETFTGLFGETDF